MSKMAGDTNINQRGSKKNMMSPCPKEVSEADVLHES